MGVQLQRLPRAGLCPLSDRGHIICPCLARAWHQHRVLNASPIPRLSTTKERETSKQLLLIHFRKTISSRAAGDESDRTNLG